MKLVVDTNIVFSLHNKDSFTYNLVQQKTLLLFAPEFLKKELKKYTPEIQRKFGKHNIHLEEFITFVDEKEYAHLLTTAQEVSPDPDDVDFFALALMMNIPIWSLDKRLQQQDEVLVITTHDLAEALLD